MNTLNLIHDRELHAKVLRNAIGALNNILFKDEDESCNKAICIV